MNTTIKLLCAIFVCTMLYGIISSPSPKQAKDEFFGPNARFKEIEVITPNTVVAVDTKTGGKYYITRVQSGLVVNYIIGGKVDAPLDKIIINGKVAD